jgi:hypothetical protein
MILFLKMHNSSDDETSVQWRMNSRECKEAQCVYWIKQGILCFYPPTVGHCAYKKRGSNDPP